MLWYFGRLYFINNNIIKGFLLTAVKCGTTRTFFKKGLLAFKTTFKNLTSEYFPLKKKRGNNAFAILTSYCTISSTPDDTTEEGSFFYR